MPTDRTRRDDQASASQDDPIEDRLDTQTIALRIIAALLLIGTAYLLAGLLVPLVLALVLTIALSPVASWFERRARFPRPLAALACALGVALVLLAILGLILYQAGTIVQDSDKYIARFGSLLANAAEQTGGQRLLESLGVIQSSTPAQAPGGERPGEASGPGTTTPPADMEARAEAAGDRGEPADRVGRASTQGDGPAPGSTGGPSFYTEYLRRNLRTVGRWLVTGLGGLLGFLGGFIVFIAYIFYMLSTREAWMTRIRRASARLGMNMRSAHLEYLRGLMVTYIGYLFLVSLCYAVVLTMALWLIGVPQPLLWGVLTGLLEVVPYFGPFIAATLPTIVALSLGTWWQPLTVLALYVILQTIEGYVIAPMLYGSAVRINPVTVIFGLLFFGWLWGPIGLMIAMPMMILLRGFVTMSPDTPALDALVADEDEAATAGVQG